MNILSLKILKIVNMLINTVDKGSLIHDLYEILNILIYPKKLEI